LCCIGQSARQVKHGQRGDVPGHPHGQIQIAVRPDLIGKLAVGFLCSSARSIAALNPPQNHNYRLNGLCVRLWMPPGLPRPTPWLGSVPEAGWRSNPTQPPDEAIDVQLIVGLRCVSQT